jgi:hypothetical protein
MVEMERPPIVVEVAGETPAHFHRGALGYAKPYAASGARAVAFYDRVASMISDEPAAGSALFGYVLVHEVGHVLSGVAAHTEGGIMRARWSTDDLYRIFSRRMKLSADDARMMRASSWTRARKPGKD